MYGVDLLNDYEEIAYKCNEEVFTQEDFENCVVEKISNDYFKTPPKTRLLSFPEDMNNCLLSEAECPNCIIVADLYIEQPIPGTRELFGGPGGSKNGGHAFMSISQIDPNNFSLLKRLTFGFYPFDKPSGQQEVAGGFFEENELTVYNIRVGYPISYVQLENMKTALSNYGHMYQAGYSNCTTAIIDAFDSAGIELPTCPERHQWPFGQIYSNPADLGEELRELYSPSNPNPPSSGIFSSSNTHTTPPPPIQKCN